MTLTLLNSTSYFVQCFSLRSHVMFFMIRLRSCIFGENPTEVVLCPSQGHNIEGYLSRYCICGDITIDRVVRWYLPGFFVVKLCFPFVICEISSGDILRLFKYPVSPQTCSYYFYQPLVNLACVFFLWFFFFCSSSFEVLAFSGFNLC